MATLWSQVYFISKLQNTGIYFPGWLVIIKHNQYSQTFLLFGYSLKVLLQKDKSKFSILCIYCQIIYCYHLESCEYCSFYLENLRTWLKNFPFLVFQKMRVIRKTKKNNIDRPCITVV